MSSSTDQSADEIAGGAAPLSDHSAALAATRPHAGLPPDATGLAATRPHGGQPAEAPRPHDGFIGQKVRAYRIVRELGRGGMGVVYEAVHDEIGQRAAVKTLNLQRLAGSANDPAIAQRFLTEAKALAMARHPGLVNIFDYGQLEGGTLFLLMEFLEGESLASRMQRRAEEAQEPPTAGRTPGLRSGQAVRLARQISDALAVLHGKGIYHRDLKPSNIHIVADSEAPGGERVKILDFGLARIRPAEDASQSGSGGAAQLARTSTSVVMGTPIYMAPEQCRGLAQADGPSDVYSLGVMLYELLSGSPPFTGTTASDLIAMHIYQPPPPLTRRVPGLPRGLASLVMSMLRKDPVERPTMAQVAQALREVERLPASPLSAQPRPLVRAAVLLGVVVALAGLLWRLAPPLRTPKATLVPAAPSPQPPTLAPPAGPTAPVVPSAPNPASADLPRAGKIDSQLGGPDATPTAIAAPAGLPPQAEPAAAADPRPEAQPAASRSPGARPSRRPAEKPTKLGTEPAKNPAMPAPSPAPASPASVPSGPAVPPKEKDEEVHVPALR